MLENGIEYCSRYGLMLPFLSVNYMIMEELIAETLSVNLATDYGHVGDMIVLIFCERVPRH